MTPYEATRYFVEEQDWETAGDDTQYIIRKTSTGSVIVVFDSSNSLTDWKNNLSFWKVPYKDMEVKFRVHAGFCKCWKLVRDTIMNRIENLNPRSILILGHSYGGALATLCMEDCWFRFVKSREKSGEGRSLRGQIKCWTFGAPRVVSCLNFKKVKERWEGTTLFNNGSDIVCTVPPFWFLYRHVTQQTHIGKLRHLWDYFLPTRWHNCTGDYGYAKTLKDISFGR